MTYVQHVHFYLKVLGTEKYEDNTEKFSCIQVQKMHSK